MAEGGRNIEDYRKFVKERLEVDYQAVIKEINVINNEIKDYEILQLAISKITVVLYVVLLKSLMSLEKLFDWKSS